MQSHSHRKCGEWLFFLKQARPGRIFSGRIFLLKKIFVKVVFKAPSCLLSVLRLHRFIITGRILAAGREDKG